MALYIVRAHSFPRKILPISAGQLAKFRGSLRQNCPNSAARHGHIYDWKLFRNFSYWSYCYCIIL